VTHLRHAPEHPLPDPVGAPAFLAAHTKIVQLGTSIIILPQRNPLRLAKETRERERGVAVTTQPSMATVRSP
jgi:alkanesulfonate monooxygenase SsuD/methylene tetrahydromethanopterin reductase-like flavin-dependent oxidoreductase (luciferase family)